MNRCDECKHKDTCVCVPYGCECFELDLEEHDKLIRADAIEYLVNNGYIKYGFSTEYLIEQIKKEHKE